MTSCAILPKFSLKNKVFCVSLDGENSLSGNDNCFRSLLVCVVCINSRINVEMTVTMEIFQIKHILWLWRHQIMHKMADLAYFLTYLHWSDYWFISSKLKHYKNHSHQYLRIRPHQAKLKKPYFWGKMADEPRYVLLYLNEMVDASWTNFWS